MLCPANLDFEYLLLKTLSKIHNKVVLDKHNYFNRLTSGMTIYYFTIDFGLYVTFNNMNISVTNA